MGTNANTITLNLNLNLKLSPTRPKTKILYKSNSAFEENKQVSVDYDEGKHEVSTRLTGLRKADIQRRYRLRVEADRFQRDWTLSEVVHEILSLRPHDDVEGLLNCWIGRFARKNFLLLIRALANSSYHLALNCCLLTIKEWWSISSTVLQVFKNFS